MTTTLETKIPKYSILIFAVIAVLILKAYIYKEFYVFTNDDVSTYIPMQKFLFEKLWITRDGINTHTLFPPGYSLILGVEMIFFKSINAVYWFNFVVVSTLTSLVIIMTGRMVQEYITNINIPLLAIISLFYPINFTSNYVYSCSSEYLFGFIVWFGIYLFFKWYKTKAFRYILISNILFGFSYLVRPEGLLLFTIASIIIVSLSIKNRSKYTAAISCLVPLVFIILPYVSFLYIHIGELTISGKNKFNYELALNSGPSNSLELIFSNLKGVLKFFISPNLLNPIILVLLLSTAYYLLKIKEKGRTLIMYIFLMLPPLILMLVMLKYKPWGRAMIPFLPFWWILASSGLPDVLKNTKPKRYLSYTTVLLVLIASTLYYPIRKDFNNSTITYKKAIRYINSKFPESSSIFCRDHKMQLYTSKLILYNKQPNKLEDTKTLLLISNITHPSLQPINDFELDLISHVDSIPKYKQEMVFGDEYYVKVYSKNN